MRQIEFNFKNNKILFDVVDSLVADAWWSQLKLKQSLGDITPCITMEPDFPKYRDITVCNNNIVDNVKQINMYGFDLDWPTDVNLITQEDLNKLHQQFHAKEELNKDSLPENAHNILRLINQYVHQLEQIMWSENNEATNYAVLDFGSLETELDIQRPISNKEKEWFQEKYYEQQNGTCLLLGYSTLGKNLGHCVWTNDVDVVKENMVRPQKFIYTQVLFRNQPNFVSKTKQDIDNINKHTLLTQNKWITDNELESYINKDDPLLRYNTAPTLAYVNNKHNEFSEKQWFDLWTTDKLISISLSE